MTLEDHLGDILRKARAGLGIASTPACEATGLTADQLAELESNGRPTSSTDLVKLATLLQMDGAKLKAIAGGWLPEQPDLGQWRELRRITSSGSDMEVHAYLVWDEVTREAAVFDTGWDADGIVTLCTTEQLNLTHLFITHSHPDHIGGIDALRKRFPKIRLHTDSPAAPPQHKNRRNDCIHIGSLRVTNRPTTGHAADGVTYIVGNWPEDAPHVAIVGDALFAGSMGGATGAYAEARQGMKAQILSLPPETLLCPGHGPLTTVAQERAHNPFG